jgi:hypothetical protein
MDEEYKKLIEIFDSRYVLKDACSNRHEKLDEKMDDVKTTQTQIATKVEISQKVDWAIFGACLAALVTSVMNLILK